MQDALNRHPDARARAHLRGEELEARETPSVTLRVDYTYDTAGFFSDPARRAAIERVAAGIGAQLHDHLTAITPSAGNTWTAAFYNPLNGATVRLNNPTVRADELVVYAAGGPLGGGRLGVASSGSWSATGSAQWLAAVRGRGQAGALTSPPTDEASWGGFVAFDATLNWYFGTDAPGRNQYDFASVASHELLHLLGFGLGDPVFTRWVRDGAFTGPSATAAFGRPVPIEPGGDPDHWAGEVAPTGSVMLETLPLGAKRTITAVDWAALRDIGWEVGAAAAAPPPAAPPPPASPPVLPPPPPPPPPVGSNVGGASVTSAVQSIVAPLQFAVGADAGAVPSLAAVGGNGRYIWTAQPFPADHTGGVRVAAADFNADGVKDVVAGTGPGVPTRVLVFDGKTQAELFAVQPFEASFTGGVFVAAGDLTGDGRAELVVTPDQGGGPRVRVFDGNGFGLLADFFGIDDKNFRGGARAAVGDLTGAGGGADLLVAAGHGGGPRVAGFRGPSLRFGAEPVKAFNDFFAFERGLRNGVFVAAADVDGDGRADVVIGGGPGGGPRVTAFDGAELAGGRLVPLADFFAGDPRTRGGVRVAAAELDGDGRADVVTGAGERAGSRLAAYPGGGLAPDATPRASFDFDFFPGFGGGIFVG